MKRSITLIAFAMLVLLSPFGTRRAQAWPPYAGYIYTEGGTVPSLVGYLPGRQIRGPKAEAGGLKAPGGLVVDPVSGSIFVADTGNNRVVELDKHGNLLREIGKETLKEPKGVFLSPAGDLYVADTGNARIARFDRDGSLRGEYGKPVSHLLPDSFRYQPVRVVVDGRGYLYVVSADNSQGIIQLDPQGTFRGFFASNRVGFDWRRVVVRAVATKEQMDQMMFSIPPSHTSLTLDDEGFLYSTTAYTDTNQIKRLSAVGVDVLNQSARVYGQGRGFGNRAHFAGIAVDKLGIISAVDQTSGKIFQYDQSGKLLFAFGGRGDGQAGLMSAPSDIAAGPDGTLYVTDRDQGLIHTFLPSEFALMVQKAITLHRDGKYEEAAGIWREVLRRDSHYELAHQGVAKSLMLGERYAAAMDSYAQGRDRAGYSRAFSELRYQWLRDHFGLIWLAILGVVALYAVWPSLGRLRVVRRLFPAWAQAAAAGRRPAFTGRTAMPNSLWRRAFFVAFHPVDGFYAIRWEGWARVLDGVLLAIVGGWLVRAASIQLTSFHFSPVRDPQLTGFVTDGMKILIPWLSWVIVQYGVTTISDGEGRFRDIFVGSAYCLVPYLVLSIPLALLSRFITLDESSLYNAIVILIQIWTVILFLLQIKIIHNFEGFKTVVVSLVTLFGMVLLWISIGMAYGLTYQWVEFAKELFVELTIR